MDHYKYKFSVVKMASRLGVSARSYYDHRAGKHTLRGTKKAIIAAKIRHCFAQSNQRYGAQRLSTELKAQGTMASRTTVARYMRELGLRSRLARKFKVTTDSKHNNLIAPNLLYQNFKVDAPGKVWVSDITYLRKQGGWEYLTTVIDLFDRKVVGYSQSSDMTAKKHRHTGL